MVPQQHVEEGIKLGTATGNIRQDHKYQSGEKGKILSDLGFIFNAYDHKWSRFVEKLRSFKDREGHCEVPARHREGDYHLGRTVQAVRTRGVHIRGKASRGKFLVRLGLRL